MIRSKQEGESLSVSNKPNLSSSTKSPTLDPTAKTISLSEKNSRTNSLSPLDEFDVVDKEACQEMIYLFARSNRQKEQWYYLLKRQTASRHNDSLVDPSVVYLSPNLSPLNALMHRIFADSLSEAAWKETITAVIERKLKRFSLPAWIEGFHMSELRMGKHLPVISDVCDHVEHNAQGLWWDMWLEYHGGMKFTLETKVNLIMLKNAGAANGGSGSGTPVTESPVVDTPQEGFEEKANEDSPLVSPDKDLSEGNLLNMFVDQDMSDVEMKTSPVHQASTPQDSTSASSISSLDQPSSRVFKLIDRFAHSRTVQYISEYKFIKKRMEAVSNTPLVLEVELERLAGRLQINIPHQPSDKLWYGFTPSPTVNFKATPFYGEREVKYVRITDWIKTKLESEFHKVFTSPNFDDISVPFMSNDIDSHQQRLDKLKQIFISRQ